MLEAVLAHLNNWFVSEIHSGVYTISGWKIELPFLINGQYFRIVGSAMNDGVYQYPASGLTDETFDGAIWALAIPKNIISLADEISEWNEKNQPSAYTSESFGGYSYTRGTNGNGQPVSWQNVFAARLSPYKKLGKPGNWVSNPKGTPPFPKKCRRA